MDEQAEIRQRYAAIFAAAQAKDVPSADARAELERRLAALQRRCTHPQIGEGTLPGDFSQRAAANECPDCGFVRQ